MAQFLTNSMFTSTLRQDMRTVFFGDALSGSYAIGQFDVRIYTLVGRIGLHEVSTTVSYSLSAQLAIGSWLAGPLVGGAVTGAGFTAHLLDHIVATETLRAQNPLFRIIGENEALDPFNTRNGIAQSIANDITAVDVAGPGAPDPVQTLAVKNRIEEFLSGQAGEISIQKNVDGALIQSANGSTLLIRGNGDALKSVVDGSTTTTNDYQNNRLILQSVMVNSAPAAGQLLQSEVTTLYDENSGNVSGQISSQTLLENGQFVRQNITDYNADGQVTQTRLTAVQPDGTQVTTVRDNQGSTVNTTTVQVFDDGSRLEIATLANGVIKTTGVDSAGQLASTITDTPDGSGGVARVIDTKADGKPVQITQHADAASLANGEQPGDYGTTDVQINGLPAVNNNLIAASIDENYPSAKDIILNRGTGEFTHIVAAGDPSNPDGTSASLELATGRPDWWNDPRIGTLASDTVSLISALRSGQPLPIVTAGFNFASHQLADPAVGEIAAALSAVGSLKGLIDGLERGDLGRILIDGGGIARSAVTIYANSIQQQIVSQYGTLALANQAAERSGDAVASELVSKFDGATALLETVGNAIAVLNIINSLAKGDIKGAVLAAITWACPLVGGILTAIDIVYSLFKHERQFEADGRFVGGPNGEITIEAGNINGGAGEHFNKIMNAMLEQTRKQATAIGDATQQPMGLIAERLPSIAFKRDIMFLRYLDPLTGEDYVRTFDMSGKYLTPGYAEQVLNPDQTTILSSPWGENSLNEFAYREVHSADRVAGNQVAQTEIFFDSIAQQFSDAVIKSGAIAPLWEVETVKLQRLSGYQYAGQTTEMVGVAERTGWYYWTGDPQFYYGAPGDARPDRPRILWTLDEASQMTTTVIALDLNGDGVITTTKKETGNGVLFDVDNDGFAEETDWIGPRDGILVLDRTTSGATADGQIDQGSDLFNDTWVSGYSRKLNVLNEINGDNGGAGNVNGGVINAQDPVFSHLKVWLDINGDGVAQLAELQRLSQLGITSLNWDNTGSHIGNTVAAIGSITRNGQTQRMESVNLQSNVAGVATKQAGNSLLVSREVAYQAELYVTAVIDYGLSTDAAVRAAHTQTNATAGLSATDEVLDGQEDLTITVSLAQLLKNDKFTGGAVEFAGLAGSQTHGQATYDSAKQTVTFVPDVNFNGVASFGYRVKGAGGATAMVDAIAYVDVGAVDDAPTIAITGTRRHAGWSDLVLTAGPQNSSIYSLADLISLALVQEPSSPVTGVKPIGYLGATSTSLETDSVGIIGFAAGKMYFAPFSEEGNTATQMPWREVLVDETGGGSGTITVTDIDGIGGVNIVLDSEHVRDGQFGTVKLTDNGDGTATYNYKRTSLANQIATTIVSGVVSGDITGPDIYIGSQIGPDDAFYVRIRQYGLTLGPPPETYEKIIVSMGGAAQVRGEEEYEQLIDGAFIPKPPEPQYNWGQPIVLDLNDNGFRFIATQNSSAFYDLAGDGVPRASTWISGQDGFLAYDANNDGRISGKAELSFTDYLPGATTDLEGLTAFDTNRDGKFSALDAQWGKFRVWQDKNEDGFQTADELSTLAQRGIESISLTSNSVAATSAGVTVHGIGSYTRIDGTQAQLADVGLAYTAETLASVSNDTINLTTNPAPTLFTGAGDDSITGSATADKIDAGTGNDYVLAGAGDDLVLGGAGNDGIDGGDGADTLWGGLGVDNLQGGTGADELHGGGGDDYLGGGSGDDALWGGTGSDILSGGAGLDTYHFALGDGDDLIKETGGDGMRIVLGANASGQTINPQNIQAEAMRDGRGYILRFSATDSLTVQNLATANLTPANVQINMADGSSVSLAQLIANNHSNHAPTLAAALTGQTANQASLWTYTVPATTFADVDAGDSLRLAATLANGDALPLWMSFNASTRRFSGTPPATSLAPVAIRVVATDAFGLTAASSFSLALQPPVNHAPTVANALLAASVNEDSAWTFTVPVNTFADIDAGDALTLSATLANGDALPAWLSFNAATRTFSGTPLNANVGTIAIKVVATDVMGTWANSNFDLQTVNVNDAPTVKTALAGQSATSGQAFSYTVPTAGVAAAFADQDAGDVLTLSAKLSNGSPLPSWLSFNGVTGVLSGTPAIASVGTVDLQVIATDVAGATVSSGFALAIAAPINHAPTLANPLAAASVNEDAAWTFTVPINTFADTDAGDVLTLSATLANGDGLPAWLSFDAATRTFSGTPLNANVGTIAIKVIATDVMGTWANANFDLQTVNVNDAPTVKTALTGQSATSGQAFSYTVPTTGAAATFADQDAGDVLTLSAALSNGGALPSWLSFNAATGVLSGTPPSTSVGTVNLQVTATDVAGAMVSSGFALAVQAATGGPTPPPGALVGTPGKDVLTASSLYREVWGLGDNDTLNGFWDSTKLVGGDGNDILNAIGGAANTLDGGNGNDTLTGAWGNDTLIGGEGNNTIKVTGGTALVTAGAGNDLITALWGDDKIDAGGGNNDINAGGGNNNIFAGTGNDKIVADWGNDVVNAGDGTNTVTAGEGRNVLVSGDGTDTLGALGVNVVFAGAGNDNITLGQGNDWVQAGKGNDVIDAGGGKNLFAFNKGDGADTVVNSVWKADTISLGGGTQYADMKLAKAGNDLVLLGVGSDRITLKNWYAAAQNQGVGKLQVLTAGGDFDAASTSPLKNRAVAVFDFDKLVQAFDAARAATPNAASGWAVSASLGAAQLYASTAVAAGYVNPWAALQAGTALLEKAPTAAINPISTSAAQSVDQLLFAALNATGNSNVAAGWVQT